MPGKESIPHLRRLSGANIVNPSAEVVAVPCLIPDPSKSSLKRFIPSTWTNETDRARLPEFLNAAISRADLGDIRVWLFDYEGVEAAGPSFENPAATLLEAVARLHSQHPDRPIILLTHSLGSFIVKQALITARGTRHSNQSLSLDCPLAVMFFAAPHQSREQKDLKDAVRSAVEHLVGEILDDDQLDEGQDVKYSRALRNWGVFEPLERINSDFLKLLRGRRGNDILITSFSEARPIYKETESGRDIYVFNSQESSFGISDVEDKATPLSRHHFNIANMKFKMDDPDRLTVAKAFIIMLGDLEEIQGTFSESATKTKKPGIEYDEPPHRSRKTASVEYDQPPNKSRPDSWSGAQTKRPQVDKSTRPADRVSSGSPKPRKRKDGSSDSVHSTRSEESSGRHNHQRHHRGREDSLSPGSKSEGNPLWEGLKEGVEMTEKVFGLTKEGYHGAKWVSSHSKGLGSRFSRPSPSARSSSPKGSPSKHKRTSGDHVPPGKHPVAGVGPSTPPAHSGSHRASSVDRKPSIRHGNDHLGGGNQDHAKNRLSPSALYSSLSSRGRSPTPRDEHSSDRKSRSVSSQGLGSNLLKHASTSKPSKLSPSPAGRKPLTSLPLGRGKVKGKHP